MKVVYLYEHEVLSDGVNYYHPFLSKILDRYDYFSEEIIICCQVLQSDLDQYDETLFLSTKRYKFVAIKKMNSLKSFYKDYISNKKIVKDLICNADLIITKQPSFIGNIAIHIAKRYRVKCLVEVVGCAWDAYYNHSLKGKLIAPYVFLTTKKSIYRADYLIYVTNEFLQKRYPTKGLSIGCSDVIVKSISSDKLSVRMAHTKHYHHDEFNLLTLGGLDVKFKMQSSIIEAVAILNNKGYNVHYHLAGNGTGTELAMLAEKLNISDKIHILGSLSHARVFDLIDKSDLYVQPSKLEGLPRSLVEAMARGCPAIGSRVGGIPELLESKYLFEPGNVSEIVALILSLSKVELKIMSQKNFNKSLLYSTDSLLRKRLEFYNKILKDCNITI